MANSDDWAKAYGEAVTHLLGIAGVLEHYRPAVEASQQREPAAMELPALALMLQSFYSGAENCLRRIVIAIDGMRPSGEAWHQQLLTAASQSTPDRPPIISEGLRTQLFRFLAFRHFIHHSYAAILDWTQMEPLVDDATTVAAEFQREIEAFFAR